MRILRDPLLHFVLLGATLFATSHYLEAHSRTTRIVVTPEQVRGMAENYRLQYGHPPSPQQLDALVDSYINEQIFYHEALKLGLQKDDEIIRRRLVQKYQFLQQDLHTPAEPDDQQLMSYYRAHLAEYRHPATVTFTHVYFSPDQRGADAARRAAQAMADRLNREGVSRASDQGDPFPGPSDFAALSGSSLARVFGAEGLAQSVFDVPLRKWSAPLQSGLGWHTVYVTERQPERQLRFDEVRERVRSDYLDARQRRLNAEAVAKLRARYEIVRE